MAETLSIEERLTAVEHELQHLKQTLGNGASAHWLARFIGAFKDDPDFDEVAQLGAEYRRSQRHDTHG